MSYMRKAEGSFGSRNGQPWTERGAKARRRAEDAKDSTTAGTSTPEALLTESKIREFLDAYLCPWCGAGPFKVVAAHTNKAHGVGRLELRERAGLSRNTKITPEDYSQKIAASSRDRLAAMAADARAAAVAKYGDRVNRLGAEGNAAANARKRDEARSRVVGLFAEGLPLSEIQREAGIGISMLRTILDEEGLRKEDLRVRGAEIRGNDSLDRATKAFRESSETRKAEFIARYDELGHTEMGLERLADEYGRSRKQVMARLRKYGCDVPDLRGKSSASLEASRLRRGRPECSVEGCETPNAARGLCDKHYRRWKKHGNVD